jgi:hypothetical protein
MSSILLGLGRGWGVAGVVGREKPMLVSLMPRESGRERGDNRFIDGEKPGSTAMRPRDMGRGGGVVIVPGGGVAITPGGRRPGDNWNDGCEVSQTY